MTSTTPSSDRQPETKRELLGQSGQYAVAEIIELDGLQPQFDVYDLVIRGHTALTVGEDFDYGSSGDADTLEPLAIAFDPVAVEDIGVELMRASHIVIPLAAIQVLEDLTDKDYNDTRWIENPLNHTAGLRQQSVTYPSEPVTTESGFGDDSDDDGAIPVPRP